MTRKKKAPAEPKKHWTEVEDERITFEYEVADSIGGRANAKMREQRIDKAKARLDAAELHLHPWKWGVWVSVVDGTLYDGSGGNEREEWYWEQRGPWVLVRESDAKSYKETYKGDGDEAEKELKRLREQIRKLAGCEDND